MFLTRSHLRNLECILKKFKIVSSIQTQHSQIKHFCAAGSLPLQKIDLPKDARVVICGGGVTGLSVAYHLAESGWTDVVVLEQGK